MAVRSSTRNPWFTVLLIVAAASVWGYNQLHPAAPQTKVGRPASEKSAAYEVHRSCTLVKTPRNDGDSFLIRLPTGREAEFRLYFVDTPESAFKTYNSGATNHERIRQQAADLGHITPEQVVEIGKVGKRYTLELLINRPFTIYTCWDSPFNDNRYHAHVEVPFDTSTRWLDEILVERGLARIKTKPADLPDGTPAAEHLSDLRQLERAAKQAKQGVWSFQTK